MTLPPRKRIRKRTDTLTSCHVSVGGAIEGRLDGYNRSSAQQRACSRASFNFGGSVPLDQHQHLSDSQPVESASNGRAAESKTGERGQEHKQEPPRGFLFFPHEVHVTVNSSLRLLRKV